MYASEYRGDAISSLPSTLRNICLNLSMNASEYRGDAISSLPSTLRNITNGSHDSAWICHAQHVPCQMRLFESSISPTAAACARSCLSARTQPLTATGAPSQTSTIPYHTIPYHTIPYHGCATVDASSGYAYHTIPYHTIPYHTMGKPYRGEGGAHTVNQQHSYVARLHFSNFSADLPTEISHVHSR